MCDAARGVGDRAAKHSRPSVRTRRAVPIPTAPTLRGIGAGAIRVLPHRLTRNAPVPRWHALRVLVM